MLSSDPSGGIVAQNRKASPQTGEAFRRILERETRLELATLSLGS